MKLVLAYVPMVLWAVGVLLLGSLEVSTASLPSVSDKAAHFVVYGVGGALAALARQWSGRGHAWVALGFVALVAVADEVRQSRLPTRHGDPRDWIADIAGALVFYALTRWIFGRKGRG